MKIGIAADHGGLELKTDLIKQMTTLPFDDLGTKTSDRVDYPHFADKLCLAIKSDQCNLGILICGTGIGISMRANRHAGIRAALVYDEYTASMAKAHNDANIICLGGRTTSTDNAIKLINIWLDTSFEGGRHESRIALIDAPIN